MKTSDVARATDAARALAAACGLQSHDAALVHDSDRIAVRLLPCDLLVRIAPASWRANMEFEATVAVRLAEVGGDVGVLDPRMEPRVHERDGFAMTFWTFYESVGDQRAQHLGMTTSLAPADYASALAALHAALRRIDLPAPPVEERIADWLHGLEEPELTPELQDRDRELLSGTLRRATAAIRTADPAVQLLHGEPHPGNVLDTVAGPRWIDLGTIQRGPIEYDLAYAPDEVAQHYPDADQELIHQFRILMWAGVATMRWYHHDQYPRRDYWRIELLSRLRAALDASPG